MQIPEGPLRLVASIPGAAILGLAAGLALLYVARLRRFRRRTGGM